LYIKPLIELEESGGVTSTNAEKFRQETIARWEEYCLTGKSIPDDVVMAWLDTWGAEDEQEAPRCFSP
jgi:predicted transcriptional regulator